MSRKIAIIGASTGQLPLCRKAKEMGIETYCFAYEKGAVCKDLVDYFVPVSIFEMDEIVQRCKEIGVEGVLSNASEKTAKVASYVAEKLNLTGVPYNIFLNIQNKKWVREKTNGIQGLTPVNFAYGNLEQIKAFGIRPCVIKPIRGSAKRGVNYLSTENDSIEVDEELKDSVFMAEEYITGKEYSVESLSYHGAHEVIQITEKITTGAPHFVELEHHQPAALANRVVNQVKKIVSKILNSVGFTNGAAHTEIKIKDDNIYLIEINPRGGGDYISNSLVALSTDCDYLKQMILVALDEYKPFPITHKAYAGVYFLSAYTSRLLPYFDCEKKGWMIERIRVNDALTNSTSNYNRDGYLIYCSTKKISV
jgi:biotin carboxylase